VEVEFAASPGIRTVSAHMPLFFRPFLRHRLAFVGRLAGLVCLTGSAFGLPLQDGEQLGYRVSWAVVPGAGEIKIAAANDRAMPQPVLRVTTSTSTRRLARLLLPFDAKAESVFDLGTGRLLSLTEASDTRDKHAEHSVIFSPNDRTALYQRPGAPEPRTLTVPAGDPTDLIMGLLQTRTWELKPGEKREALVLFDDDFYELTIHFARYEEVRTPLGTFNTVVLEPRMDRTAPKGMFRRGGSVRVWIAQNEQRLPVRFEVEFKIGTGTATLESYTPPKAAHAANPRS
jgi:hypothetical protein